VLGPLTSQQQEDFKKNPRYIGYKFPDVSKPETLEKHYLGKMSRKAQSLMLGMLIMDPVRRLSALDCLAHEYFDGLRDAEVEELIRAKRQSVPQSSHARREASKSRSSIRGAAIDRKQSAKHKTTYATKFQQKGADAKQSQEQSKSTNKQEPTLAKGRLRRRRMDSLPIPSMKAKLKGNSLQAADWERS